MASQLSVAALQHPPLTPERVRHIVCRLLNVEPARLDPERALSCYGLDSLNALELVALLEDAVGRRLPEWLLLEHPTLSALTGVLCQGESSPQGDRALMIADSVLPDDIQPVGGLPVDPPRHVLLTGATGFLGASILEALLEDPLVRVTCLVRSVEGNALSRVRANLERYRLWQPSFANRIEAIHGDLGLPHLDLDANQYATLSLEVETVCHAAADVNWVLPYRALRASNVTGTTELLRFACAGRPKPFTFVSSLSVCYANDGPRLVDEGTDMLADVDALPLGYAQTKCVAEALVRQAGARGLPTRIYRPTLIAGDSRTGAANVDDLISRLIKGCIQMGVAPDLDWAFDAVPADYAARAIVALSRLPNADRFAVHLAHPRPRHWRECVLWMNFFGYPVRLQRFERWRAQLAAEASSPDHALHGLRSFFMRRGAAPSVAERYETAARARVCDARSRALQDEAGLKPPALNAELLNGFFEHYIAAGFLPPVSRRPARRYAAFDIEARLGPLLREHFGDATAKIAGATITRAGSDRSIIGELTAWRHGSGVGLTEYRIDLESATGPRTLDLVVKIKAKDDDVLDVAQAVADVCDERVARELEDVRDLLGIRGCHLREPAIYETAGERAQALMPKCFGTWRVDEDAAWGLALEKLEGMHLLDAVDDVTAWTEPAIAAVIDGLARSQAVWFGREDELRAQPWIGHVPTLETAERLAPLWRALAEHAAARIGQWAGTEVVWTHRQLASHPARWWPALQQLPRTLIHNDFNSRNIGVRQQGSGLELVAYDWELACVGAPQRDLAELLCFVLPSDASAETVDHWVERHRLQLERESGVHLAAGAWRAGLASALAELLVHRLSFYALIDRVSPQSFLPRVVRAWARLDALTAPGHQPSALGHQRSAGRCQ